MSMARVVITVVVVEGRSKSEVARDYGVSRRWVQTLVARYLAEGEVAFEPRSRRPHSNPRHIPDVVERHRSAPSVATIWRVLDRRGFITPQPHKRPRSSWKRFQADLPNEVWQADITH
jgi:transposase